MEGQAIQHTGSGIHPLEHLASFNNTTCSGAQPRNGISISLGLFNSPLSACASQPVPDPTDADDNFITFLNGGTDVGAVEGDGGGGVTFKSGSADFAEWLPRLRPDGRIEAGDIVGLQAGSVSLRTDGAHRAMVVSRHPIVLGNSPGRDEESGEKLAFIGQVRVGVHGPVRADDLIAPSGLEDGTGRAIPPDDRDAWTALIVGTAWEDSDDPGLKDVNVAVGLPLEPPGYEIYEELMLEQEKLREQVDRLTEALLAQGKLIDN